MKNILSFLFKNNIIKFDRERIVQKDTVVHCRTKKQAINLLKWADSIGLKWCDGRKYTKKNMYSMFKKNTIYNLYYGTYSEIYRPYKYTILKYENALLKNNVKLVCA